MKFKGLSVLVTDGAGRQTLTILHDLKELGCHVTVLCASKLDLCYWSNSVDEKILNKRCSAADEQFLPFLIHLLKAKLFDVLLPVAELTTNKITKAEKVIKQYVKLACAPRSAYINAFDKQRTFEFAGNIGIPIPKTRMQNQSVEEYLSTVKFPLIIKPRNGVGSIGFHKFEKADDFEPYIAKNKIDLNDYVLQEFVDYDKRYGTILFVDQNGETCMAYADEVLRWYPLDAGSACMIRSIDNPEIIRWSSDLLKAMKWNGIAALSFMVDKHTHQPKLLEINGRIPASIRLSRQCGFNVAELLLEMAFDEKVRNYGFNDKFGASTRHFHAELPWFIHSSTRFSCEPSWFSWKKTKDVVIWGRDLKPCIAYTLQKLFGYREFIKKRQH